MDADDRTRRIAGGARASRKLTSLGRDQRGAGIVEYAIILTLISVAGLAAWRGFGERLVCDVDRASGAIRGLLDGNTQSGFASSLCPQRAAARDEFAVASTPRPPTGPTKPRVDEEPSLVASSTPAAKAIKRVSPDAFAPEEARALHETLAHIDAHTRPSGTLAKKWGLQFKNWNGDLPGPTGDASPYHEFRVAPPAGTSGAGPRRIVVNPSTGEVFYTWTHYGDAGPPAFVQIR